ncbi:phosphopantetheine-binding protein [Streptomyces sp. GD-15H]
MLLAETVKDIVVLVERLTATRPAEQDASPISDEAVLALIRSRLPGFRDTSVIAVDTDLWEAGMDSLGNIAIMVAVEEAYGVEFPDELLTREVFSTAGRIAEAVRRIAAGCSRQLTGCPHSTRTPSLSACDRPKPRPAVGHRPTRRRCAPGPACSGARPRRSSARPRRPGRRAGGSAAALRPTPAGAGSLCRSSGSPGGRIRWPGRPPPDGPPSAWRTPPLWCPPVPAPGPIGPARSRWPWRAAERTRRAGESCSPDRPPPRR